VGFGLCTWLDYSHLVKVLDYFLLEDHASSALMAIWSLVVLPFVFCFVFEHSFFLKSLLVADMAPLFFMAPHF
jgi:hypothetical protein